MVLWSRVWNQVMPVTYQIDSTRHVIHTVCSQPLTFAQVIDHFRELSEDPACSGRLDVLLNVTAVGLLPNSSQIGAVGTALSAVRKKVEFGACAIIAASDAMFGMMRIFEVQAGDYFATTRVFRKSADAEAWLASQPTEAETGE
jgi:hypothetical protein